MARYVLRVNGKDREVDAEPGDSLLSVLRYDFGLTGSRYGCGEGQCGACTVLIDGQAARSCITKVDALAGKQITTIEGLEQNGRLHPLQEAFIEADAMQCGYCIPGMIMSAKYLLMNNAHPTVAEIQEGLSGNLCRCGGYHRIIDAVTRAAAGE